MSNECKSKRDFSVIHLRKPGGAKAFCKYDLNKFLQGDIKLNYETYPGKKCPSENVLDHKNVMSHFSLRASRITTCLLIMIIPQI